MGRNFGIPEKPSDPAKPAPLPRPVYTPRPKRWNSLYADRSPHSWGFVRPVCMAALAVSIIAISLLAGGIFDVSL
jgi:hypothetical protein